MSSCWIFLSTFFDESITRKDIQKQKTALLQYIVQGPLTFQVDSGYIRTSLWCTQTIEKTPTNTHVTPTRVSRINIMKSTWLYWFKSHHSRRVWLTWRHFDVIVVLYSVSLFVLMQFGNVDLTLMTWKYLVHF